MLQEKCFLNPFRDPSTVARMKVYFWQSIRNCPYNFLINKTHVLAVCIYFAIFYMFENGADLRTWSCWCKLWWADLHPCLLWIMSMNEWIAHVKWMRCPAGNRSQKAWKIRVEACQATRMTRTVTWYIIMATCWTPDVLIFLVSCSSW